MIKGVNKYVIEVVDTGNMYYERALLFIKPQYSDVERAVLEKEARKVLRNMDTISSIKQHKSLVDGAAYLAISILVGIVTALIFVKIFV